MTFSIRNLALSFALYLACISPHSTVWARSKDGESLKLDWEKPSSGDAYGPGDTIIAQWTSKKAVVSPSVSLCSQSSSADDVEDSDTSGCGASVWPQISQDGHSYSFSLAVPDIPSAAGFHLRIKDDFGNTANSPTFSLSPSQMGAKSLNTSDDSSPPASTPNGNGLNGESGFGVSDGSSSAQAPLHGAVESGSTQEGASSSDASNPAVSGFGSEQPVPSQQVYSAPAASSVSHAKSVASYGASSAVPETYASPVATGAVPNAPGAKSGLSPDNSNGEDSLWTHDGALSRAGVPTAAIAVPISLVGATVLVSLGLCIVHRRSLAAQRTRNAHLIGIQRSASVCSAGSKAPSFVSAGSSKPALIDDPDIEKAIDALCGRDSRLSSRHSSLRREDSVPGSSHSTFPRPDMRRERTYEWPHDRDRDHDYNLRFSRDPSDRYIRHPHASPRPSYHRPRSSLERKPRCTRGYQRRDRNSIMRMFRYGRDRDRFGDGGDDDGASSTDTILSGYVSPSARSPMPPSHRDSYLAQPRLPPRSHSRQTAPEVRNHRYHRSSGSYDADSSPSARSRRS